MEKNFGSGLITILVTKKDILAPVPPKHHVVDTTRYMYPWLPCHTEKLNMSTPNLLSCKLDPLFGSMAWGRFQVQIDKSHFEQKAQSY